MTIPARSPSTWRQYSVRRPGCPNPRQPKPIRGTCRFALNLKSFPACFRSSCNVLKVCVARPCCAGDESCACRVPDRSAPGSGARRRHRSDGADPSLPDAREIHQSPRQGHRRTRGVLAHKSDARHGHVSACPRPAWRARSRYSARRTRTVSWSASRSLAWARWPMASTARTAGPCTPMTGPMLKVGKELDQTKIDADFYSELRDPKKYPTSRLSRRPPSTDGPATRSA